MPVRCCSSQIFNLALLGFELCNRLDFHLVCVCLQTAPSKMLISPTELERGAIYTFHLNTAQVGNHRTYTTEGAGDRYV